MGALDDGGAEAGRDEELRSGGDGAVDLLGADDGAGPDDQLGELLEGGEGGLGARGAVGDLDDVEAAGEQGPSERHGVVGVVDHDDGDDPCRSEGLGDGLL